MEEIIDDDKVGVDRGAPRWKSDVGLVVPLSDVIIWLALSHLQTWIIISKSSLFWQTLALVYMRQSLEAFGRISCVFLRERAHKS